MAKDDDKIGGFQSTPNPPVQDRKEIAKQKQQGPDDIRDRGFAPPPPPTTKEIETAEGGITEAQKNARNKWNFEIKPILKGLTSGQLREKLSEIASLDLPEKELRAALASIESAINAAASREQAIESNGFDPKEIQEKTDKLNGLWDEFKSDKFQADFKKYADKDAASLAEIDRLLADPSKITQEDRRRLSGDYLTPAEIEARDREIEERRHQRSVITGIHDGASELAHHHGCQAEQTAREIEALRAKGERSEELEAKRARHKAEQKKHLEKLKEVAPAYEKKEKDFQKLHERAEKNPENSELLKKKTFIHFQANKDEYHKEIAGHKNPVEAGIVKLLTKVGLHEELAEINKNIKANLDPAVENAKKEAAKQKERCGDGLPGNNPVLPIPPHMPPPPAIAAKKVAESNNITTPVTPTVKNKKVKER